MAPDVRTRKGKLRAPRRRQCRAHYTTDALMKTLRLEEAEYKTFYSAVERIITRKGWIRNTFRSIAEKDTTRGEVLRLLLNDDDTANRFPRTISCLGTQPGQDAFGILVTKICSNFRRRERQRGCTSRPNSAIDISTASADKTPSISDHTLGGHTLEYRVTDSARVEWWDEMVEIVRLDGSTRPLCRICDLVDGWPNRQRNTQTVIEHLDFERFKQLMHFDHNFKASEDIITWVRDVSRPADTQSVIENARQWKAVMARMVRHERPIEFTIARVNDIDPD